MRILPKLVVFPFLPRHDFFFDSSISQMLFFYTLCY